MYDHFGAEGGQWCTLVVEGAKDLVMGGKLIVDSGLAEHVEGYDCLVDELAP